MRDGRGVAAAGSPLALLVRPAAGGAPFPCLAGPSGTGKTSLAAAVAAALGRARVQVMLGGQDAERLLHGAEDGGAGRIVEGLCEAGVNNLVFILEGIDRVDDEAAGVLLDLLEPKRRRAFKDAYLDVPFDLCDVLWIVTATDPGRIPAPVRKWLAVIELSGYSTEEKLDIAQRYLLARPFDAPAPASWLSPAPAEVAPAGRAAGPTVVADLSVSSLWDLESSPPPPPPGVPGEDWRMAACTGDVVFEPEAVRRLIEDHTNEAGVAELNTKLATICRRVVEHRPPGRRGPEMVTPAVVREVLGAGEVLPAAVRAVIARERRRLAAGSSDDDAATKTNDWIACLEKLPWTRRSEAPVDLARARAALDAGHAGLDDAKSCILEYLAGRRRNPRSGAVLCLAGPPGVGKTSLAKCTAEALGRGFVRLACGGLRDESDLRGHNRTWKDAQSGWILRELRRVGSKDPVVVLDEIDKIGTAPAAVLLEVLDPAQNRTPRPGCCVCWARPGWASRRWRGCSPPRSAVPARGWTAARWARRRRCTGSARNGRDGSSRSCGASASAIRCSCSTSSIAWTSRAARRRRCSKRSTRRGARRSATATWTCRSTCPRRCSWRRRAGSVPCRRCCGNGCGWSSWPGTPRRRSGSLRP